MSQRGGYERWWLLVFVLLAVALVTGGSVLIFRHFSGAKPVEIAISSSTPTSPVEIYLSGEVASEGIYVFGQDATLQDVLQRAGEVAETGESIRVRMCVLRVDESPFADNQDVADGKVNINTASAAELETLSGIGPVRAQAIIDYRNGNGLFRTIDDLINVPGIGPKTLEAIRDQITVV
ncbi:MAG: ComEA family DNA-binding protein [Chloroflexi bacterium]|nr:ComEA family DNA-binding protein [Chloroflexota bacterium]